MYKRVKYYIYIYILYIHIINQLINSFLTLELELEPDSVSELGPGKKKN